MLLAKLKRVLALMLAFALLLALGVWADEARPEDLQEDLAADPPAGLVVPAAQAVLRRPRCCSSALTLWITTKLSIRMQSDFS
jgi:hypothetical protein